MATETLAPPVPSTPPDEQQTSHEDALYEIVDGVRVELPATSIFSHRIASRIFRPLAEYVEGRELGSVDVEALFILDVQRNLRRRPDIAFVSAERWPLDQEIPEEGDWEVIPDLAVEVTSPNDLYDAVMVKVQEYFSYGVREVWVVWSPKKQVHVYRSPEDLTILREEQHLDGGNIVPGFSIPVADLFRRTAKATT